MLELRPFQRRAVKALESGRYDVVVMSVPRAQGKSTLAAELCLRALTPGDVLFHCGAESHLVAASIGQSRRTCFKLLRRMVEELPNVADYKISESANACHVRHRATNTRVSVVAGSAKSTLGLVGCPLVVVDEPGSYELEGGAHLWASLTTALGKPESELRLFVIGHLAPKATQPGHWYHDLVHGGTSGRTWVYFLAGDPKKWKRASEIRRCSPLSWRFSASRAKLLEQRDDAVSDSRLKAEFLSYRLNVPTADEAAALLTVDDWKRIVAREVPELNGAAPIVGIDIGANRAWSAAVAVWRSGRVEALAVAPGIPSIASQEKRDKVTPGHYQRLVDEGTLEVADGVRVPSPALLLGAVNTLWSPRYVICDRFRLDELKDCVPSGIRIVARQTRWSQSTADIRALRRAARDGDMAVDPGSRALLQASLSVAQVVNDDDGNVKLHKRGTNNTARDDVAAALILAVGAIARGKPRGGSGSKVVVPGGG